MTQNKESQIIKLGSLAIEGSSWAKMFDKMNQELLSESQGKIRFRFYFGRDESDLIELLEQKQIDAISITTVGLGSILPDVYILQIPFLFSSYSELDYVKTNITAEFENLFEQKNYQFLGWIEMGFMYLFSKTPIKTQTDLQRTKLWVKTEDPISRAFAMASGNNPISLSIESVTHSLERGDLETVYNCPLGCIAIQWYPYLKYMTDLELVAGLGATIIDKNFFFRLSPKHQTLLKKICEKFHHQLIEDIRWDNDESLQILKSEGMEIVSVPHQEKIKWQRVALQIQNQFAGQYYSIKLLEKFKKLKADYRNTH